MGANIGTTATAFIAVFNMDIAAKKAALSHFFSTLAACFYSQLYCLFLFITLAPLKWNRPSPWPISILYLTLLLV